MNRDEEQALLARAKLVLNCGCGALLIALGAVVWAVLKGIV